VLTVQFASNISWTSPMEVLQRDHSWWEAYVTDQLASAPAGLRGRAVQVDPALSPGWPRLVSA